jgi:hypothetical protein
MRYFIYLLIIIAAALITYNITYLDFDNLLTGDSSTALIGVFSSACVIVLMSILLVSRNIQKKKRGK